MDRSASLPAAADGLVPRRPLMPTPRVLTKGLGLAKPARFYVSALHARPWFRCLLFIIEGEFEFMNIEVN